MFRNAASQWKRDDQPQRRQVAWHAISLSLLALFVVTQLAPSDAVAQGSKKKNRSTTAKSNEPATKLTDKGKDADDGELKFTAEQIEKAKSKYTSAEEAFGVGAAHYNSKNYAASREPFEAALILAPEKDIEHRLKVYGALTVSYRQLETSEQLVAASEYIIQHSNRDAEKSLTRRSLMSFVHERGKIDPFIKRHEERLKQNPKDWLSVYLLSEVYSRVRENPERSVELLKQLAALDGKNPDEAVDINASAKLAMQYIRAKEYQKGAELYEQIAPKDKNLEAWHWKEAAAAWLKLKQKDKALAAAKKSQEATPEKRNELLAHFWHRGLGDVFLAVDEPKLAIPHFEKAIENTKIEGYVKDCKSSLAEAREKAKAQKKAEKN